MHRAGTAVARPFKKTAKIVHNLHHERPILQNGDTSKQFLQDADTRDCRHCSDDTQIVNNSSAHTMPPSITRCAQNETQHPKMMITHYTEGAEQLTSAQMRHQKSWQLQDLEAEPLRMSRAAPIR